MPIDDAAGGPAFALSPCQQLHQLAKDHQRRIEQIGNQNDYIFVMPSSIISSHSSAGGSGAAQYATHGLSPLEAAIAAIVQEVLPEVSTTGVNNQDAQNDDLPWVVEYWVRQEYLDLAVHSDIDEEELLRFNRRLRYPDFGHVLYLDKEPTTSEEATSVGPTVIFPTQQGGWNTTMDTTSRTVPMVTVPVVRGRLLQFPGSWMHAVPKPLTRWYQSGQEQDDLEIDEQIQDDDDDETSVLKRSVILFNLWKGRGPTGVFPLGEEVSSSSGYQSYYDIDDCSETSRAIPEGICLEDEEDEDTGDTAIDPEHSRNFVDGLHSNYIAKRPGDDPPHIQCQPFSEWHQVPVQESEDENLHGATKQQLYIPLMGTRARRLYPARYVWLNGNAQALKEALQDPSIPRSVRLQES